MVVSYNLAFFELLSYTYRNSSDTANVNPCPLQQMLTTPLLIFYLQANFNPASFVGVHPHIMTQY